MRDFADENVAPVRRVSDLRMAFQAEIRIALGEELIVDAAVRLMADHATFTHRFVFVDERTRLLAMALGAGLIQPRHGQTGTEFQDVFAVRVMALDAIHLAFHHRMVMRQVKFGVRVLVALITGRGVFAGIQDELTASTTRGDVFAAGAVAGFAAGRHRTLDILAMKPRVRAAGKFLCDGGMTIQARLVADKRSPFDMWRRDNSAGDGRAGAKNEDGGDQAKADNGSGQPATGTKEKQPAALGAGTHYLTVVDWIDHRVVRDL